jgi:hypothetical protein
MHSPTHYTTRYTLNEIVTQVPTVYRLSGEMERRRERLCSGGSIEKPGVVNHVKDVKRFRYIGTKAANENIEFMTVNVKENSFRRNFTNFTNTDLNIRKYNYIIYYNINISIIIISYFY